MSTPSAFVERQWADQEAQQRPETRAGITEGNAGMLKRYSQPTIPNSATKVTGTGPSYQQLKRAARLQEKITHLKAQLARLLNEPESDQEAETLPTTSD